MGSNLKWAKLSSELLSISRSAHAQGYPPSLQIRIDHKGKKVVEVKAGARYPFYDLGSLTKILVSVPLCIRGFESNLINLENPTSFYLGFLKGKPAGAVRVRDLLTHTSGLAWWRPFYKDLLNQPHPHGRLKSQFLREPVKKQSTAVYSDLDFILLGWILEEVWASPLDVAAEKLIFSPLGIKDLFFRPKQRGVEKKCAPTERSPHRGKVQGQVFDDNCYALGGVSGHAGLFGGLAGVSRMGEEFYKTYWGESEKLFSTESLRKFTGRAIKPSIGDWALGFVIPSRPVSTGGRLISHRSFGHTGFTGTSLWCDMTRKTVVTILSNRTYPDRDDERFKSLRIRLHDVIWRSIDEK